ncbi:hypothetical protein Csa_008577 [Cucumis sativus]|uniref:Uncharacterized protein n=1 Tax=Cucumis sativus TaxID=3659 RepID=A0A0A0KRK3_CUCSA|nr:hypothetical protein Csa_008577 [Cucumis sativus]
MGQHAASIEEFPYQIQLVFIKEHLRPALLHTSINTAIFMLLPSPLPLSPSRVGWEVETIYGCNYI